MSEIDAIKPHGPAVTVTDVPDEERKPGTPVIWTPAAHDVEMGVCVKSGIEDIDPGDVVYYHKGHGTNIKGVKVINYNCIIATESL